MSPTPARVRVRGPGSLIAVVPHLLGFHPANSLVVLGIGGPHARIRLAFRYDLPDPPDQARAAGIAEHAAGILQRENLPLATVVGYGDGPLVTPAADVIRSALPAAGIEILDVIRVHEGRYWSCTCTSLSCCPPDGTPVTDDPASAVLAEAGLTVRSDRAALAATLAADPESTEPMAEAIKRARQRAARLIEETLSLPGHGDLLRPVADAGRRSVRRAVTGCRRGTELPGHDELAWLGFALTDLQVRDDAWARMDPQFHQAHQRLWRQPRADPASRVHPRPGGAARLHRLASRRRRPGQHRHRAGSRRRPRLFHGHADRRRAPRRPAALRREALHDTQAGRRQLPQATPPHLEHPGGNTAAPGYRIPAGARAPRRRTHGARDRP